MTRPDPTTTARSRLRRISALSGWRIHRRALGIALGMAGALAISALTFGSSQVPPIIPALLYLIPVTLATAAGGRVAGWITLIASVVGLEYLFLPPIRSWEVHAVATLGTGRISGWIVMGVFALVGAVALELVAQQRDARRRARAAEARLALLSDASALFANFDQEKTLGGVAGVAAATFSGVCLIHLQALGGHEEQLIAADPDAGTEALLSALRPPMGRSLVDDVLGSDHPAGVVMTSEEFLRTCAGTDENRTVLSKLPTTRWILAPLVSRDRVMGEIALGVTAAFDVGRPDVEVVEDLAERVATSLAAAFLVDEEQRARADADAAAKRTARLQAVTSELSASVTRAEVGAVVARGSREALRADRAAVYELTASRRAASLLAAEGFSEARIEPYRELAVTDDRPLAARPAARDVVLLGLAPGSTVPVGVVDDRFPPDPAAFVIPLFLKGQLTGHLYLGFDGPRAIDAGDVDMLNALAGICAQVLDRARLVEQEQSARAAAEQSALRLSLVSRASALLAVELDYPRAYSRLAELLVEQVADLCLIDVTDGEAIRRVAAAHADPARNPDMELLRDRYAPTSHGKHPVSRVLRTGQPEMSSHMTEAFLRETVRDEEHFRIVRALGFQSFMCVPLAARGRILGTITLVSTDPARRYGDADMAVAQEVARRAAVRIDNARLYADEQEARRAAEAAASLIAALSEAVTLPDVLDVVSEGMRDALGATNSTVALLDADADELEVVRWVGRFAAETKDWSRFPLAADLPMSEAVRSNAPVVVSSQEDRTQRYPLLAGLESPVDHSLMCLPLQVEGRAIGGIALGYPDVRTISPADMRLAMTLAGQAAQTIGRALLFESELASRHEAEEARERLSLLADASRVLSSSLDWNLTLSRVAHLAVPAIADWCAVDVLDETGNIRRLAVAHADPQKAAAARRMELVYPSDPDADTSAARVIRSGTSELIADITVESFAETGDAEVAAALSELGLRSIMVVPLPARGNVVGAISFALGGTRRRFGREDLELAEDLARRAGVAADNARLYQERDRVAHTLQQSLLPQRLPAVPGVEFEGRYHPLGSGNEVGGDFYDVFDSGNGTWGMTIGDVCGKGPEAAAVMGVVRYTLRASAMHEDRPSNLLRSLNEALRQHLGDERFCTVAYVRIRPRGHGARLTVCLAGHPPPIVVRADGRVERAGEPGTILGVLPDVSLTDVTVDLDEGDAVVLFTDGVTDERRGADGASEAALMRALEGLCGSSAGELADAVDRMLIDPRSGPPHDDAAILVARVFSPTPDDDPEGGNG